MEDRKTHEASGRVGELWVNFTATPSERARNRLLLHSLPFIRSMAERLRARLPDEVDVDDLASAGISGLMDALTAYGRSLALGFDTEDRPRAVGFEGYCTPRIRGAMLDELRSMDWVPQLVRMRKHRLSKARHAATAKLGRPPTDEELAQELRVSMGAFRKLKRDAAAVGLVSLNRKWFEVQKSDEFEFRPDSEEGDIEDTMGPDPAETASIRELPDMLARLTRTERLILVLYYFEGLTMREIAEVLGITESRISQMRASVLARLRAGLTRKSEQFTERSITVSEAPEHRELNLPAVAEAMGAESESVEEAIPSNPVVEVFIEPGDASAGELARLYSCLTGVYEALGGPGLRVWGGSTHVTASAEAWV